MGIWYIKNMWGFSKKRFLITLVLSIVVWSISVVIQLFSTFSRYIGTFSTGCQVTGYPIDLCELQSQKTPALLVIIVNITFWFWVIHLFWGWFGKKKS